MTSPTQPKKRLVICCDGTWNNSVSTDSTLTNVSRLSRCVQDVADDGVAQIVYYHAGIGSGTSRLSNSVDGATGRGISFNVRNVYTFICLNFSHPDDEIYLVGFSRGAYTVRCVASFISSIGLLTKDGLVHLHSLYKHWHKNWASLAGDKWPLQPGNPVIRLQAHGMLRRPIKVEACAVWDTVSALGIPIPFGLPSITYDKLVFVEKTIPKGLKNAFQALALNESRKDFRPVLWPEASSSTKCNIRQCWFLGSHSDVGGGYEDTGLANMTLIWMMGQLRAHTNLGISDQSLKQLLYPANLSHNKVEHFTVHDHVSLLQAYQHSEMHDSGMSRRQNKAIGK
ncbi:MAG: hypothetical protein Q9160_008544 [Pyrenula sp. 1 TL-2023]